MWGRTPVLRGFSRTRCSCIIGTVKPADVHRTFISEWTVTIILLLFGTTTLLQAFVIPSGSMEATLLVGDHVLVDKIAYAPPDAISRHLLPYTDVRRGDVIVFRYPLDIRQNFVKRAIGIPGDRIHFVNKQLILNGKSVNEPYAIHVAGSMDAYRDNFPSYASIEQLRPQAADMIRNDVLNGELVVPPGSILALGDNRDNSDDSRFWGLVPRENIVGTPFLIYWSFDAPTEDLINGNIGIDHLVDVATHFFTKTRWSRTFKLVREYRLQP
jgi:signal peptidase I